MFTVFSLYCSPLFSTSCTPFFVHRELRVCARGMYDVCALLKDFWTGTSALGSCLLNGICYFFLSIYQFVSFSCFIVASKLNFRYSAFIRPLKPTGRLSRTMMLSHINCLRLRMISSLPRIFHFQLSSRVANNCIYDFGMAHDLMWQNEMCHGQLSCGWFGLSHTHTHFLFCIALLEYGIFEDPLSVIVLFLGRVALHDNNNQ